MPPPPLPARPPPPRSCRGQHPPQGAAYVYMYDEPSNAVTGVSAGSWRLSARLKAPALSSGVTDTFGWSVACFNDTIAVAAPNYAYLDEIDAVRASSITV